jgi:Tfp pilus assembly protein PilZ
MTSNPKQSKRAAFRFKFGNKIVSYMAKGKLSQATLQNISTCGCFVTNNTTQLSVNDQVLIVIELKESERPLELKANVIRIDDNGFSVEFIDIEESFLTEFSTMLAIEHRSQKPG